MKALPLLVIGSAAHADPCPTPRVHVHHSLDAAKQALGSNPPIAAPELVGKGPAFFVDVPLGSPEGEDSVNYKVDAILVRSLHDVIVVDDLARWLSVIPPPGKRSPTTPALAIHVDGKTARLEIRGKRDALVDIARARFLGCTK